MFDGIGFHRFWLLTSIASLCALLYGMVFTIWEMEGNSCRMTYMFEYPQFVRIHFDKNKQFPGYGLYAYSEGYLTKGVRAMKFTGAPIIFVPGNGGSYKQARSLASVAIRKGIDNDWNQHLDYFSIDFNGEYSALFGGFLENQKMFLQYCITTVLNLYKELDNGPKQVILIGHSMGGKIAQSVLIEAEYSRLINVIISIASPLDRPVINVDGFFEMFYNKVENTLSQHRTVHTNTSLNYCTTILSTNISANKRLDNILLLSIGGGSRDILVNDGFTHSKYSDIHALTTSIPNVWLSTDHLCSMWCLQLVLVINRFLYSIIAHTKYNSENGQHFIGKKDIILGKANHFFTTPLTYYKQTQVDIVLNPNNMGVWTESSQRVYSKDFQYGINETIVEMIRFIDSNQYKMFYAQLSDLEQDDWIFGCAAIEVIKNTRFCSKATSLSHYIKKLPSTRKRMSYVYLDLHRIKLKNPSWTHIILRLLPTKNKINFNVDIFDPTHRIVHIHMPKWYSISEQIAAKDTIRGSSLYEIKIHGLHETYQSLAIILKTRSCTKSMYHGTMQVCVPWTRGCDKYQTFTEKANKQLYVHVSKSMPYNYTNNFIIVKLHLHPSCRYVISYRNSVGGTMSRIGQQYLQWLPAHLTAILLLALRHQLSIAPENVAFKCGKLHAALFSCSSFLIITVVRVLAKFLCAVKTLPQPDSLNQSLLISAIIHGSALALLALTSGGLWLAITLGGNLVHFTLLKLIELPVPTMSATVLKVIEKIPITAGVILISIASASCGGVALICGCCIYFIMITKEYEDYLEAFVHGTTKKVALKLFGKFADKFLRRYEVIGELHQYQEENDTVKQAEGLLVQIGNVENSPKEIKKKSTFGEEQNDQILNKKECDSIHEGISNINFHMTMFLLFLIITILNIPSALSWTKNLKNSESLNPDPSLIPAVVVILCASLLWQFSTPRNVRVYSSVTYVLYICACVSVLYCQDSVHRLNNVISAVYLIITVHQLSAPKRTEDQEDEGYCIEQNLKRRALKIFQKLFLEN